MYDDVFLQTWGDGPNWRYWTVLVNGSVVRPVNLPDAHDHLASVREREEVRRKEREHADRIDTGTQTLQSTGPWMERTRWPITYQGVRRDAHGLDVTSPSKDEQRIWHLTEAVQAVLGRREETMRRTGRPLWCWLVTTRPSPCFPKPFKFLAREQTRRSYRRWLKSFIAFVFRAWRMDPGTRSSLAVIRFSQRQSARLRLIWEHPLWDRCIDPDFWGRLAADQQRGSGEAAATDSTSEAEAAAEIDGETASDNDDIHSKENEHDFESDAEEISEEDETDDDSGTESSSREPTSSNRSSEMHAAAAELLQLLFELCIAFMTEEFRDGQPGSSVLVYYSGILALQGNGETFRTAKLFTPILSQLIYIQRLLFLEYALPMVEGAMDPLAEFQSLRDFGRVIGRTDPPSFLFRWSEDGQTISHGSKHVTMDGFRRFCEVFTDEAEHMCRKLMAGVLSPVDLSQVKDEIGNTRHGFSFVHHPGNQLSEAYLELSTRACTTRRNGLMREGRWNWKAIFLYFKKVEALSEAVAGMCYMNGGQLPRVSELFGLECENGPGGLYVYNGRVFSLIRHHKARRSTNREFYVARYLSARASQIVYYYLVYIWPFVRMLRRERRDSLSNHISTLLFCSDQTPNRPWEARKLTAILQRASTRVWGWPVNAQLCRQLTIAITEKHVKEVHQRFNRYDDRSPNADINVAFAWQSGHRPLQRANTYGLDGAFPTHLQPSLLRVYEWVSMRWHEFLHRADKGSPSDIEAAAGEVQQQSLPAVLGQEIVDLIPTSIGAVLNKKREQCIDNNAIQPSHVTNSNAGKRLKHYGNETAHPSKATPTPEASQFLGGDSGPATGDLDVASTTSSPRQAQQRKHGSAATTDSERQKVIDSFQAAQAMGDGIPRDNEPEPVVPQGKKSRAGFCGQLSKSTRLSFSGDAENAINSSHSRKREGFPSSSPSGRVPSKVERPSASVDLKTLKNQIRIWSERCSFCYIRGYWWSRDHTIAKCPVAGSDQIRQTRNLFRKKMIDFHESGGSFCSGQCQLSMDISLQY
ncbi:hypothetical protein DPSP01_014468 [Paraphaeosphaeria sporulosa]